MANERRLIVLDHNNVRRAFDRKFKETMELINNGKTHLDNLAVGFASADGVLGGMPIVDAVEVVRCKDCLHYHPLTVGTDKLHVCVRAGGMLWPTEDRFCSYGARKSCTQAQRECS